MLHCSTKKVVLTLALFCMGFAQLLALTPEQEQRSVLVGRAWLEELIDTGRYGDSWMVGAIPLQLTMKKAEWIKYLQGVRAPFGPVKSRELVQQLPAQDPKGLPAGDYMVLQYDTTFESGAKASELETLVLGSDGDWHVLSYFIK